MFETAVEKHNGLMKLGMQNEGCDRHLFGLLTVAQEDIEFKKLPEIFTDPSFTKRLVEVNIQYPKGAYNICRDNA